MRSLGLLFFLGSMGCESDATVKVFNAMPDAVISSPTNGADLKESTEVTFQGSGSDPDHATAELEASWQTGTTTLCEWGSLDEDGKTQCPATISPDMIEVTLLIRDPAGSVATASIAVNVTPNADPLVDITSPTYDPTTDEELPFFWGDEPIEFEGIISDEEDAAEDLNVAWSSGTDGEISAAPGDSSGTTRATAYLSEGIHTITLTVTDSSDNYNSDTIDIQVGPDNPAGAPDVAITSPVIVPGERPFYYGDQAVEFEGLVTDDEDVADTLMVTWSSDADGELASTSPDTDGTTELTAHLSQGLHTITLSATDSDEKVGSDSINIEVGPDNTPPSCNLVTPETGATGLLGELVIFGGTVGDPDISVDTLTVNWMDGETLLGSSIPTSIGNVSMPLTELEEGPHVVSMVVSDEMGATCTDQVIYTVLGAPDENNAPEVTLTSPFSGSVVNAGDTVLFSATVSDEEDEPGELLIQWMSDLEDAPISTESADSAGFIGFSTTELGVGVHTVELTVTDSGGLYSTAMVLLNVHAAPEEEPVVNSAPSITISHPLDGAEVEEGDTVLFSATVSDEEDEPEELLIQWSSDLESALISTESADSAGFVGFSTTDLVVGIHTIELIVTDTEGLYSTAMVLLNVQATPEEEPVVNSAPSITISHPLDGADVEEGDTVLFAANVSDEEDDDNTLGLIWMSNLDGSFGAGTIDDSGYVGFTTTTLSLGTHIVTATVTDSGGLESNAMVVITVDTATEPVDDGTADDGGDDGGEEEEEEEEEDFLEEGDDLPPELEGGTYAGCDAFDPDNLVIFGAIDAALFCACGFDEADNVKISSSGSSDINLSCLDIIDGALEIDLCGATHIDLSNVASVGDGVQIHDNYDTESIDMGSLTSIGESFNINNNQDLEELTLTSLETIDGQLYLSSNNNLPIFSVPALTVIEGSLQFNSNNGIEEIHFDNLTTIEGQFQFDYNHSVETISMPSLTELNGQLYIYSNNSLEGLDFGGLVETGSNIEIRYNSAIEIVDLSSLQVVNGSVQFDGLNQLSSFELPALIEVNGSFNMSNNSKLDSLAAPLFSDLSGSLTIRDNTDLTAVDLNSLFCIDEFTIVGNNMVPEDLHALLLQLSCDDPGSEVIFRTDDATSLCEDGDIVVNDLYIYAIDPAPLDLSCIVDITGKLEIEFSDAVTIDLSRAAGVGDNVSIHDNYDTEEIWLDAMLTTGSSFNLNNNVSLNLLDLDSMTDIGGQLYLSSNNSLDALYIPNLQVIEGSFQMNSNSGIELVDLPNLYEIEGQLQFDYNHSVQELLLPDLVELNGQLYIYSNNSLEKLDFGGLVETGSNIEIRYNNAIESVSFDDLEVVNGSVQLDGLNQLSYFEMPALDEVTGSFNLSNNSKLESFAAPVFTELSGSLTIRDNSDLQTVDLSSLECIEDFTIVGNDLTIDSHHALLLALTCSSDGSLIIFRDTDADDFCATGETVVNDLYISPIDSGAVDLSCITQINGKTEIEFSKAISIDISNAASIADSLSIHDNYDTEVIDFTSLVSVGESFNLNTNIDLEELTLSSLQTIEGQLYLSSNNNLSNFSAPVLTTIEGSLQFNSNNGIEEVNLDSLTTIEGQFQFDYNHSVESISMPSLTELNGQLYIYSNNSLESINVGSLVETGSNIEIRYNNAIEFVNVSSLQVVNGTLQMDGLNQIEALDLAALKEVNGSFNVSNCSSMLTLSAPLFDDLSGSLTIRDNPDLYSIDLSSLTCVSDYTVVGNDLDEDDSRDLLLHIISGC